MKHIHFIGICGVAMSAIAIAFKKEGWTVTGSDVGFYPPVSTHLKDAGIDFYPGWHPDRVLRSFSEGGEDYALVVVGNVASSHNPEWLYVQEKKLNYCSYPEVIAKYFVKKNSIVVAGTFGKSTSTALMTWILREAGFDPSYMFGGIALNDIPSAAMASLHPEAQNALPAGRQGAEGWSVLEGDEYKASRTDNGPKFAYYAPTHLLLTSVVWDHADVYPTEASYRAAFQKLLESVPVNGLRVLSEKVIGVIPVKTGIYNKTSPTMDSRLRGNDNTVTYGKNPDNDYVYQNCSQTKDGLTFEIVHEQKKYSIKTSCLGEYMADNITGCFALASEIGITPEKIIAAIRSFRGMKRRLEKRFEGTVSVFDDIAHSPSKATAILETLKAVYKNHLIAVFEPNTGNRRPQAAGWYDNAFAAADEVIVPHLTKIKVDEKEAPPFEGEDIARLIARTHQRVTYIDDDAKLVAMVKEKFRPGAVVVFLGSHGFRGMIEELINALT